MSAMNYEIIEVGNPLLAQVAEPVIDFSCSQLSGHIEAMERLMNERGGVGIAAPQIGVSLQLMIVASRPNQRYPHAPMMAPLLLINPRIVASSEVRVTDWEGCLSVPGLRGRVTRQDAVTVGYQDRSGRPFELALDGFPARVFLHELDHLLGKTFLDRLDSVADLYSEKEYLKRIGQGA